MKKIDVSLHADEPLRAGLLRVADALTQDAVNRIRCPSRDRGEDVHLVRVTIKRLRAILGLIRPVISKAAFDRENARLRKAARRLSFARDSDVARQTLAALPFSKGRERDAAATVLAGFNRGPEAEISKATDQIELDLEQTQRNLHGIRISCLLIKTDGKSWSFRLPGPESCDAG